MKGGALVIRTLPNGPEKQSCDYSKTNPTYMTREAMVWAREHLGIDHILLDLPSADREVRFAAV